MRHFMNSLRALLAADEPADPRKAARYSWVHRTVAAWQDATRRCDDAWCELVRDMPEEHSSLSSLGEGDHPQDGGGADDVEMTPPPEQAEVDALWAQLNDVIQKDLWPKELYWGGI